MNGWKLVHNTKKAADAPEYKLYEVGSDPREQKNLAAEKPEIVRRLAAKIVRWRKITASEKLKSDADLIFYLFHSQRTNLGTYI